MFRRPPLFHRGKSIEKQVNEYLIHFLGIQRHRRQIGVQVGFDLNVGFVEVMTQHGQNLLDNSVQIIGAGRYLVGRRVVEQLQNDCIGFLDRVLHVVDDFDKFLRAIDLSQQVFGAEADHIEGVLHFVGNAGRKATHRLQLFGFNKLKLGFF